jgi:hypothetical protein
MKTAAKLPPDQQLRILEKICVLQSINNVFDYKDLKEKKEIVPAIYGYYSLTPLPPTNEQLVPEKIELMIFDPRKGVFAYSPHRDNKGIRISDLMDAHTLVPHSHDVLKVSIPIDISVITRNEVDYAVAGRIPIADNIIKPQKPSPPRKQEVGKECSQS